MNMHSLLQSPVQNAAEAIATVLRLDVTVVDAGLRRVAGTGPYRNLVGMTLHPDSAFGLALRTGQTVTIVQPLNDPICAHCGVRQDCREAAHIAAPILGHGGTLGVIGLIAFDQAQKDWLIGQHAAHAEFIARMSELLGSKLAEERMIAETLLAKGNLDAVLGAVREGIVAVNGAGAVSLVNPAAWRLLGLVPAASGEFLGRPSGDGAPLPAELMQLLTEALRSGEGFTNQERQYTTAAGHVHLMTTATPIRSRGISIGAVATLQDMRDVHELVYRLAGAEAEVTLDSIIGRSPALEAALNQARQAARGSATVLIVGESGTGKELFARGIHAAGSRRRQPFIAINCAAIPEELLESELFGYADGAFTGARKGGKPGKAELADHGTLFLDEIGDMSLRLQAKLLRLLQEGEVGRVGGTTTRRLDVRIIAATHSDLESMMRKGEFRADLFYRLNVIPLEVPPLRQRKDDLPLLIACFCRRYAANAEVESVEFTPGAMELLMAYDWPGNVRELKNAVEYAVNMATAVPIPADCLPRRLLESSRKPGEPALRSLEEMERDMLRQGLAVYGPSEAGKKRLAAALGIGRATVYRKLRKYGLLPSQAEGISN
ncbi:MAG TPA: sigma 54-interacting transcriptional regulator [Symbiobacteriaceae bacterium]|jgi:transcriptional regulator with PAS, ATPase and Fis domain